jgi:solute:Na+ symporter, SSS family
MTSIDWAIVLGTAVFFVILAYTTKKYTQSSADFLAANRCAGRYLLTMAEGIATLGAISIIATWQMIYRVGPLGIWWSTLGIPVTLIIALAGWVIYRYRETRVLTMAQFFEVRYSRNFRIFAGIICWISGIINFGIFPAVGANFFINYCGLPEHYQLAGFILPTYQTMIVLLVGIALYFTFIGGQISVLVTDFFQSFFCNIVLVAILILLLIKFPLRDVFDSILVAEEGKSMVNPFDARKSDFNPWYFIIGLFGLVFNRLSWQGTQAYNCSAKSPHEAKMAGVLAGFRGWGFAYAITLIPIVAYMIMHHPNYTPQAEKVRQMLSTIENDQVRDQMLVPMTMNTYMPVGLIGAFAAVMFAAFISTHDTYLHSWGSVFIQDVVMPLRKKSFTNKQHMLALRLSILFVAIFICIFSTFFRQTQHILLFFALTGAIWLGGIGAVIIGGLYTRWGSTAGAYAALISGSILAFAGMICEQLWESWYGKNFFLTGQEVYFFTMLVAVALYVVFSLLGKRTHFDLDKMLHRGKYMLASEHTSSVSVSTHVVKKFSIKKALGYTDDFTLGDKLIYGIAISKSLVLLVLFVVMVAMASFWGLSDEQWCNYHYYLFSFMIGASFIIAVWLSIGGICDAINLFKDLKSAKRDIDDDGRVFDHNYEESVQD